MEGRWFESSRDHHYLTRERQPAESHKYRKAELFDSDLDLDESFGVIGILQMTKKVDIRTVKLHK